MKRIKRVLCIILAGLMMSSLVACDSIDYKKAIEMCNNGNYEEAIEIFRNLGDYKDSAERLAQAETDYMYVKYEEVFRKLDGNFWFFDDTESVNDLSKISFTKDTAKIESIFIDGNGKHEGATGTYSYIVDDDNIILMNGETEYKTIKYSLKGKTFKLGNNNYLTESKVKEDLAGNWTLDDLTYVLGSFSRSIYNVHIDSDKIETESATRARDGNGYYYYGPYSGKYKLNLGGFDSDIHQSNMWFFLIKDGKAVLYHFGKMLTKGGKGLVGENGYSVLG